MMSYAGIQFKNEGEEAKVLINGHHDAIVSNEDFEKVQQLKAKRSKVQLQDCSMKMSF